MRGITLIYADPSIDAATYERAGLPVPAVDTKGRPIHCADKDCGRRLNVGDIASCRYGKWYGRTGTCTQTHAGGKYAGTESEVRAKVAAQQANASYSYVPKVAAPESYDPTFDFEAACAAFKANKAAAAAPATPESAFEQETAALAAENFSD